MSPVFFVPKKDGKKRMVQNNLLKNIILTLAYSIERIWKENLKVINITKYFKSWWDNNCSQYLEKYRLTKSTDDWKQFKKMVKNTK